MSKEGFVISTVNRAEFESLDGDIYATSIKVKKGSANRWQSQYTDGQQTGSPAMFHFYSFLGYDLRAEIVQFSATSYGDELSYDVIDLYVRLTPELLAQIIPPEISSEFGY